jgi:hypothetical protein
MIISMTTQDIASLRLLHQNIATTTPMTAEAVVRHMGAMQAQDYHGSLWSLGLRTGQTLEQIVEVIESYAIVRTWPQRGTLHFVPGDDAKWLVGLSAERLLAGARTRRQGLGLDDGVLTKSQEVLTQALGREGKLSRPEAMDVLEHAGISPAGGRGYHILWYLSQTGITFIGPMEGKQQTISLLDQHIPHPNSYTREAGMTELAKRYFFSHGPATLADFRWWSGMTTGDVRTAVEANQALLASEQVDGREYWMSKQALSPMVHETGSFLLPGFDEYMLGYQDRSVALDPAHGTNVVPGGNGMFLGTIIIRGRVVGTWRRSIKKSLVVITISPFAPLSKSDRDSLDVPAETYGRFMGLPAKLDY